MVLPPLDEKINYFELFEIPLSYFIDVVQLEKKFYELTKLLHPDRHQSKSPDNILKATQWTATLNKAFNTLKNSDSRAEYIFKLAAFGSAQKKGALPPSLAETYFELQESLEDISPGSHSAREKVHDFSKLIESEIEKNQREQDKAFKDWEIIGSPLDEAASVFFQKAFQALQQKSYLFSMAKDLEKKWLR